MHKAILLLAILAATMAAVTANAQHPPIGYSSALPVLETTAPQGLGLPVMCDDCPNVGCDGCDAGCDGYACRNEGSSLMDRCKCKQQHKWWGFPEEFQELPLGAVSYGILRAQVSRGEQARLTLYDYDFVSGTPSLNRRGRTRLRELAELAQRFGGTIKIQPVGSELDTQRLLTIQNMSSETLGLHPDQIVVATPIAAGLRGEEAPIIRQNHLEHVRQYGVRDFNFGSFTPGSGSSSTGTGSSR